MNDNRKRPWFRHPAVPAAAVVLVIAFVALRIMRRPTDAAVDVATQPVTRQDVSLSVEATGTIEPIDLIEVRSKASGQITSMPVKVGSVVKEGDLLVQVDPTNVRNQYDQTTAALRSAQAKLDISQAQKKRSDDLFAQAVITATEHESAILDYANAQAALVAAKTNLELARQALTDATVKAPSPATILSTNVTNGTVISSATLSASGGTSLLTMADLSHIRMRALVSETDVGNVRIGHPATVTVDAYPNRTFRGVVEQIEPQAVVQQSVTQFPVLISISNEQNLLLPGMNGEVSMLVDDRPNVLAVPVDAVRTMREIPAVASALGLNADSVRAQVQRQAAALIAAGGDSLARRLGFGRGAGADSGRRGGGGRGAGASADSMRARWMAAHGMGGGAAGGFRRGGGGQGGGGQGGVGAGGFGGARAGGLGGAGVGGAGGGGGRGGNSHTQVAFVQTAGGLEPRAVLTGITNFDYAEVLGGLKEGDQVAMLSVAELQAKRQQSQNFIRQRMGGGMLGGGGGTSRTGGGR